MVRLNFSAMPQSKLPLNVNDVCQTNGIQVVIKLVVNSVSVELCTRWFLLVNKKYFVSPTKTG